MDIFGSTIIITPDMSFRDVINAVVEDGYFKIVRIKNCYAGDAFWLSGYGDVKLNVRCQNGFVGEIIIGESKMMDTKMNGVGHAVYEIYRQLRHLKDKEFKIELSNELDAFSSLIYKKPGEDQSAFSAIHAATSSSLQVLALKKGKAWHGTVGKKFLTKLPSLIDKIIHFESSVSSYNRLLSGSKYRNTLISLSSVSDNIMQNDGEESKKNLDGEDKSAPKSIADTDAPPRNSIELAPYAPGEFSNDTYFVAMITQDKLRGIERPAAEYEKLRDTIGAFDSVAKAMARAESEIRRNRGKLMQSLQADAGQSARDLAAVIEREDFDNIVNQIFT